jgi:hypothetical protein
MTNQPPSGPEYPGQPLPAWGQPQPARPPRPWWKKKRFNIPLGLLAFLTIVGIFTPSPDSEVKVVAGPPAASEPAATTKVDKPATVAPTTKAPKPSTVAPTPEAPTPKKTRTVTSGERNALGKAEDYLSYTAFSRKGLIKQLKFEDYTTSEATYAVDHVTVNWNRQAVKKAKEYLSQQSFSRSGLITQLKFEGFTSSQAKHGVAVAY